MSYRDHKLKYRTLSQLLDAVADEWAQVDREGLIEPSQLIKVVTKINKELGFRITRSKEVIKEFDKSVINLPDDMEHFNFAFVCGEVTYSSPVVQGTISENIPFDCSEHNCCDNQEVFITPQGDTYIVVQKILPNIERTIEFRARVTIKDTEENLRHTNPHHEVAGLFVNKHFLKLNHVSGTIYINYEGTLEDDDGNLLVIDHPLINDYYEYAIKRRVLENMYFNGDADVQRKLEFVEQRYREARKQALSLANTPDYKELEETAQLNREAMFKRYYSIYR